MKHHLLHRIHMVFGGRGSGWHFWTRSVTADHHAWWQQTAFTDPVLVLSTVYKLVLLLLTVILWDWYSFVPLYRGGKWRTTYMISESSLLTTTNAASLTNYKLSEHLPCSRLHARYFHSLSPRGKLGEAATNPSNEFQVMLKSIYFKVICNHQVSNKCYFCKGSWKYQKELLESPIENCNALSTCFWDTCLWLSIALELHYGPVSYK